MLRAAHTAPTHFIAELKRSAKNMNKPDDDIPPDIKSTLDAMNKSTSVGPSLIIRICLFATIVIITLTIGIPLFGGYLIGAAMSAGGGVAHSPFAFIPFIAVFVIIVSAIVIFKK